MDIQTNIEGSSILVVDDNVINQKVLAKVLESNGYLVFCADNGQGALQKVDQLELDLILLDVQMPEMDGFEVCRRLKSNPKTEDIPVIFITATDTVEGKVEGFEAGAADYIPRPLQMPEVLARVNNQLTIRNLQRENEQEKERLERILSSLPIPYLISSVKSGDLKEINDLALNVLEVERDNLDNYSSLDFYVDPADRQELIALASQRGRVQNKELELKSVKGRQFTTLYSATPLRLSGEEVYFVTFADITERKEMERALELAATTDYLTNTFNRRAFTQYSTTERSRANRNKHHISLLMIDIDHFKKINDTHGHDVGDDALKVLVELVTRDLRLTDIFGRLGGEEFALLLPETGIEGARVLSERIRERVENNVMKLADGQELQMTISGGLAVWEEGVEYDDLLKICDERLYEAKSSGRNKIVSA